MKKFPAVCSFVVLALAISFIAGCGGGGNSDSAAAPPDPGANYFGGNLAGSWAFATDPTFIVNFNENGTYVNTYNGEIVDTGTWTSDGNILITTQDSTGGSFFFHYTVSGDTASMAASGSPPEEYVRA